MNRSCCLAGIATSTLLPWTTNLRDTNYKNIQYTQNEALRISTGCHKMASVDHLHAEANVLKVREHSELLYSQYLARCLEPENVNNSITTRDPPKSRMKETLFTRHRSTVEPVMIAKDIGKQHSKQSTLWQSIRLLLLLFATTRSVFKSVKVSVVEIANRTN